MGIIVEPVDQIRNLDPYQQKLFQYDSIDSRVYLAKEVNRLLRALAADKDFCLTGLNCIVNQRTSDGFRITIQSGSCIIDNTFVEFPSDSVIEVDYNSTPVTEDINGSYVIFLSYKYIQTVQENPARIKAIYKNPAGNFEDDPSGYDASRDRIILAEVPIDTTIPVTSSYRGKILYKSPIATSTDPFGDGSLRNLWRFDNNFNDALSNNDGTGNGSYYFVSENSNVKEAALLGSAVFLNSSPHNYYISINDLLPSANFSFSFRAYKYNNNTNKNTFFSIADGTGVDRLSLYEDLSVSPSVIKVAINGNEYNTNAAITPSSEWIHVALVQNNDQTTIFINGTQVANLTTEALNLDSTNTFIIGQRQTTLGGGFNVDESFLGGFDEFRYFTKALSSSEILELQNSVFPPGRCYIRGLDPFRLPPLMDSQRILLDECGDNQTILPWFA